VYIPGQRGASESIGIRISGLETSLLSNESSVQRMHRVGSRFTCPLVMIRDRKRTTTSSHS
jgi:hypothetical protein